MTRAACVALGVLLLACGGTDASEPAVHEVAVERAAVGPASSSEARPDELDPAPAPEPDLRPITGDLTVDDVRRVNDEIAARAREAGAPGGPALAACRNLEATGLIARCTSLGAFSTALDRASFELPDAATGRGLIQHFDSDRSYAGALDAVETFVHEFGTFYAGSARARILFVGAEHLSSEERAVVRRHIEAL